MSYTEAETSRSSGGHACYQAKPDFLCDTKAYIKIQTSIGFASRFCDCMYKMQFIVTMVLRVLLRILRPVIAFIDHLVPGVRGKDTILPDSGASKAMLRLWIICMCDLAPRVDPSHPLGIAKHGALQSASPSPSSSNTVVFPLVRWSTLLKLPALARHCVVHLHCTTFQQESKTMRSK